MEVFEFFWQFVWPFMLVFLLEFCLSSQDVGRRRNNAYSISDEWVCGDVTYALSESTLIIAGLVSSSAVTQSCLYSNSGNLNAHVAETIQTVIVGAGV
jgi:hypothetical protein